MLNLKDHEAILGKAYQEMGNINIRLSEEGIETDIDQLKEYENFLMESE